MKLRIAVIALAWPMFAPEGSAQVEVFWNNHTGNRIEKWDQASSTISTVIDGADGLIAPGQIDLDHGSDQLYFFQRAFANEGVGRVDTDGSGYENPLFGHSTGSWGCAIGGGKIYYQVTQNGGEIRRVNLDGTGDEIVFQGVAASTGIEIDTAGGRLYVGTFGNPDVALQIGDIATGVSSGGANGLTDITQVGTSSSTVAVDPVSGKIYYTPQDNDNSTLQAWEGLWMADLDGSNPVMLINEQHLRYPDTFNGELYFVSGSPGTFCESANLDGTGRQQLFGFAPGLGGGEIAVGGVQLPVPVTVYWNNHTGNRIDSWQQSANSFVTVLDGADGLIAPGQVTLDHGADQLYFFQRAFANEGVGRVDTDGSGYQNPLFGHSTGSWGCAIGGGKIYYQITQNGGEIRRVNLDGTGDEIVFQGVAASTGIEVDAAGGRLYVGTFGNPDVALQIGDIATGVASGGANGLTDIMQVGTSSSTVAVDPVSGKIYYTPQDNDNSTLQAWEGLWMADLDGSNPVMLINEQHLRYADIFNGELYFVSGSPGTFCERANLDGTDRQQLFGFAPGLGGGEITVGEEPPGPFPSFCDAYDGSLAFCPCSNPGLPDRGCDVQEGTGGVRLDVVAQQLSPQNRITMTGTGFRSIANPSAVLIRSSSLLPTPAPFGDGVRCVTAPVVRLGASMASNGSSTHTFGHGVTGGVYYYQLWFRHTPAAFCTPIAFNSSSGRAVTW
jgi:DNA-binding beta-propeller fold protein YncE